METQRPYIFQIDAAIVKRTYNEEDNFLIEYTHSVSDNYCIVYFSSNNLYYPNDEMSFNDQLLKSNRFEWYKNRIKIGKKHIFIRDIIKQWYLLGISNKNNSPVKLFEWLKEETKDYKVITIGSSAGGFAAVTYGQMLHAQKIYSFNGQFEINSLLKKSKWEVDPVLFDNQANPDLLPFYDTLNFITNPSTIYYFNSKKNHWDTTQAEHVKSVRLKTIAFYTTNHGLPFLRSNLPFVLNAPTDEIEKYVGETLYPLMFSLKTVGLIATLKGAIPIIQFACTKIYLALVKKFKNNKPK